MRDRNVVPKFCVDCGAELQWSTKFRFAFDEDTGASKFVQYLICPKKRWYQIIHRGPLRFNTEHYKQRYTKFTTEVSQ